VTEPSWPTVVRVDAGGEIGEWHWLDPADLVLDAPSGLIPEEAPTLKWLPDTTRGRRG
jgi:hypothetical protein